MSSKSNRLAVDSLFMLIATAVAQRGTCTRAKVGALIVQDRRIISTGYVGSAPGEPHCIDVGCILDEKTGGCVRTIHAEANAIAYAARSGLRIEDATLYSTHAPCRACSHLAASSGIRQVVYLNEYRDQVFTPGVSWSQFTPHPWSHPFIGYPGEKCLLCEKELSFH